MKRILCSDWPNAQDEPSCPPRISRVSPASKSTLYGHKITPLLTRLVGFRWLDSGLVLFLCFKRPRVRLSLTLAPRSDLLIPRVRSDKPCARFDKAPETFFLSLRLTVVAPPRIIRNKERRKKKIPVPRVYRFGIKTRKNNLANNQPCWPQSWSIMHNNS